MRHIALFAFLLASFVSPAFAQEQSDKRFNCPEKATSCKVLVLTPEEEQLLVNPRGILDTAAQARQLDLANVVAYFRAKIDKAEAGTVKAPPTDAPKDVPVPTPDPRK